MRVWALLKVFLVLKVFRKRERLWSNSTNNLRKARTSKALALILLLSAQCLLYLGDGFGVD